jgi:hypothetical protein
VYLLLLLLLVTLPANTPQNLARLCSAALLHAA